MAGQRAMWFGGVGPPRWGPFGQRRRTNVRYVPVEARLNPAADTWAVPGTAAAPLRMVSPLVPFGLATVVKDVPVQCRVSDFATGILVERSTKSPTAHTSAAEVAVTPSNSSSSPGW